jgi:hypothetical protein
MWYGRMAFLLKGCNGDDALISEHAEFNASELSLPVLIALTGIETCIGVGYMR